MCRLALLRGQSKFSRRQVRWNELEYISQFSWRSFVQSYLCVYHICTIQALIKKYLFKNYELYKKLMTRKISKGRYCLYQQMFIHCNSNAPQQFWLMHNLLIKKLLITIVGYRICLNSSNYRSCHIKSNVRNY